MSEKQLRKNSVNRVCNERILSAYPAHKQMNLMREGGHDLNCMDAWINAQRDACKVHELAIDALAEESLELRDYDIHAGWPDEVDVEEVKNSAEAVLDELESVKDAIDSHPRHVEPPAAIADLFHPDKPMAPQAKALRDKWLEIGHQIHRGEASADEIRKHERLSSEIQFLNSHAFDGV